jgi:ParB-like chromosome segregation protein Spo0J
MGGLVWQKVPKASKNNAAAAATEQMTAVPEGLKIVLRPLESLVPYARTPRAHSNEQVAQIAASIKEFGFTNPILLDGENGLIAGHGRLAAARLLGLKMVPCIELGHLSEPQKLAYIIADNKLALNAGWDEELLRLELIDLKGLEFNLDLLGFDASELADITLGRDVNQPEYYETAADDVKMVTCPKCGQSFPT